MEVSRYFEHQGSIIIAKRDADICIPDMDGTISIEQGSLSVYGLYSDNLLLINRKKLSGIGDTFTHTLSPGECTEG